jgi:hypothetical protein
MNEDQSEFPYDNYIFNNIDLDNVVQTIENFESTIGEKNVKINSGNSSKFSILPYASRMYSLKELTGQRGFPIRKMRMIEIKIHVKSFHFILYI